MLDIINKGLVTAMHQSSNYGASGSKLKGNFVSGYKKEDKRVPNLDVKARIAIRNSLPYSFFLLVQNCSSDDDYTIISF